MTDDNARPRLNAGARPLWRDGSTLQFGLDPGRAVVIEDVDSPTARLLFDLDGTRSEAEVLVDAAAAGLDVARVTRLLTGLRQHRLVVDGYPVALSGMGGPDEAERLAPDHASLGLLHPEDLATQILSRRRATAVVVHGAGRVGTSLAALLASAGVGRVAVVDDEPTRLADCAPAGLSPTDERRGRGQAAADVLRRCAPAVDTAPLPPSRYPDLVVLSELPATHGELLAALHAAGVPHLFATVRETTAVVGPLVLPGESSCLRCADLHRRDRDPAWPTLAAQLATGRRGTAEPCDVALATLTAAMGALQALSHLDGGTPATTGGSLEMALPTWQIRRRVWAPHVLCECGASQALRAG